VIALLPRRLVLCLLAAGFGWPSAIASAAPLPDRAPPAGFTSFNGAAGGRTLAGTFSGNARSAAAVLGGMLRILGGYFDGAPALSGAVGDPADRGIMAFFDAQLQGTPVRGATLVQLNDDGGGGVAVLFDRPADIGRSFGAMVRQLGGVRVPGGEASRPVTLPQQTTPDGKAAIGVPPGWRITGWGTGAVDVAGPQGQLVDVGTDIEVLERHPTAPPTGAGQAAYLFARSRIGGRPHYHFALVNTAPIDPGSWTYYYSTVGAPDGVFQRDFALMLDVCRSWSLNQQMLRDRMQDAAATIRQTGEILRSAARGQSEAFDRANRGFSYYLHGLEVLEHTPSGARGSFDRDYADAVVRADPTKFRLVPPSQYRSGDQP
jgi:hypothetical protein